jgi:flavin-dependent dehydrogenase
MQIGESLPPESGRLLQYLHPSLPKHLSSRVESGLYTSCTGNASVWSSSVLEERHAIFNPFGHGLHLNRANFDELLKNTVINCTSVSESTNSRLFFEKGKFKGIHRNEKGLWIVEIEDGKEVRKSFVAKWVVDATGRKASVATKVRFYFKKSTLPTYHWGFSWAKK